MYKTLIDYMKKDNIQSLINQDNIIFEINKTCFGTDIKIFFKNCWGNNIAIAILEENENLCIIHQNFEQRIYNFYNEIKILILKEKIEKQLEEKHTTKRVKL